MKKVNYLLVIIFCMLCFAGCQKEEKPDTENTQYYNTGKIISMGVSENKDYSYAVYSEDGLEPYISNNRYLVSQQFKSEHVDDGVLWGKYDPEIFTFDVYDMTNGKKTNSGDILDIMKKYDDKYNIIRSIGMITVKDKEKYFIGVDLYSPDVEIKRTWLYINMENNESFKQSDFESSDYNKAQKSNALAQMSIAESLFEANKMDMNYIHNISSCNIVVSASVLPKNNAKLYGLFPELKNVAKEGNNIIIGCNDNPSAEKFINLLIEDGQEIVFKNVILPYNCSIDGQQHEIHSFEEFDQYVKKDWSSEQ